MHMALAHHTKWVVRLTINFCDIRIYSYVAKWGLLETVELLKSIKFYIYHFIAAQLAQCKYL